MTIDRLRDALSAIGPPPDARELSEMLWLACHISPPAEEAAPAPPPPPLPPPAEPLEDEPVPAPPPVPSGRREPLTGLHPHSAPGAEPTGEATEVLVPTAPMLADPRGVQRALRPLKRRVPSGRHLQLDEDATAIRIADTGLWTPVLVPEPERWLSLTLVVDTGGVMRLWRPLARELAETLLRQGAFQDVHVAYLDASGGVASTPDGPRQDPRVLLDASGRRAVLVLSDCSGPHWWDGRAPGAVRRWASSGPTAILQPLAERLWRRTAAPAVPGVASLPRPGAPNTDLRFAPYDGAVPPGLPVPVLEVAPRWFGAWARLVSGAEPQPAAVASLRLSPGAAPVRRERELPVGERVRRFLATASADAAELAAHVAVSVPSLPVMRLIQHRILGGSGPGQLAEVLLSGLLRPAGGVRYEFVPGAREALLDTLPRPEALHTRHVLAEISAEIERRAGTSADRFRALLPTEGGPVTLTTDTDHFALVNPETRSQLTPGPTPTSATPNLLDLLGAPVGDLLDRWDHPPDDVIIGLNGDDPVGVDILGGPPGLPHGLVLGPGIARRRLLQTIVWSIAMTHSPTIVTLAFAPSASRRFSSQLKRLPHAADSFSGGEEIPALSELPSTLEPEMRRRAAILESAGVDKWDEYQAARSQDPALAPLPALLVILDRVGPILEADPDLIAPLDRLCEVGPDQGIRFILASPDNSPPPRRLTALVGWNIGPSALGDDLVFVHEFGRLAIPGFRPTHVPPEVGDAILEQMSQRAARPQQLPSIPFEDQRALPPSTPRSPAIGYGEDGSPFDLSPLDLSSEITHGLIVGDTEARQRMLRTITRALTASYSPDDLRLVFAGLGEHPLGEPFAMRHIRFSDDELLGAPQRLQQFIEYLTDKMDARTTAPFAEAMPRMVVVADISLTFPSSKREFGEALLSLAQRGRTLGIQLVLSATTVEDTTIWNRLMPLLDWRIAASPLPPAEFRRAMGRATLPFPNEQTAYLLERRAAPRQFTVAPEPPEPVVSDFDRRMRPPNEAPASAKGRIPIGVEDESGEPVILDFDADPYLVIAGPPGSGRARLLHLIAEERAARGGARVLVFDRYGVLQSLADEFGLAAPVSQGAGYTTTAEEFAEIVSREVNRPTDDELFLVVIDRELDQDALPAALPLRALTSSGRRVRLVASCSLTLPGQPLNPLVRELHEIGASAVLLGHSDGEEARLFGAEPPPRSPRGSGAGVLVRRGERRFIQITDTRPDA